MRGRESFGYVVAVDGPKVTLNLKDSHKGQFAAHRDGVSAVVEMNGLFGVDAGNCILVLRVNSLSFAEPKEAQRAARSALANDAEPLRQLIGTVAGWVRQDKGKKRLHFTADSLASPSLGAEAFPLSDSEILSVIQPSQENGRVVCLGRESRGNGLLEVPISDLLGRHVAVLGSTGQGKSCFTAAILQQLIQAPRSRIVIFDINGEYEQALMGHLSGNELKVTKLGGEQGFTKIPYYALGRQGLFRMLLPSDKTQRPALTFALEHLRQVKWFCHGRQGAGLLSDTRAVLFDDCQVGDEALAWQAIEALRNNTAPNLSSWPHMSALSCLIAESHSLQRNPRSNTVFERNGFSYSNIAPLVTRIRRFIDDPLFTSVIDVSGGQPTGSVGLSWQCEAQALVEKIFGSHSSDWKVHIVDLRNVAQDIAPLILGSLLESFAYELFNRGQGKTHPTLLVLEEAHHYLRHAGEEDSISHGLAYERLAKEGRKFGIGLWISTQRPVEVSSTVLAQCGTWVVFRLTSDQDLKAVSAAGEWMDRTELNRIAGLPRRQALVFGVSVPIPLRIEAPEAKPCPRSYDPDFGKWDSGSGKLDTDEDDLSFLH